MTEKIHRKEKPKTAILNFSVGEDPPIPVSKGDCIMILDGQKSIFGYVSFVNTDYEPGKQMFETSIELFSGIQQDAVVRIGRRVSIIKFEFLLPKIKQAISAAIKKS